MSYTIRHQSRIRSPHPVWFRWVAAMCVSLAALVGSAQAVHVHGQWLPRTTHAATQPAALSDGTGEEHCPLCVALHSALPVTLQLSPEPVQAVADLVLLPQGHEPSAVPHFALFCRPPPFLT